MRWIYLLAAVVLFSFLSTTRADDAPAIDAAKLPGTWKLPDKNVDETMTFNKDGTFSSHLKMGDSETTMSGTWKLDGNTLTETCTKSSNPNRVGKDHSMTVTKLTDDKLVMQDGPDKEDEIAMDRVKDQ